LQKEIELAHGEILHLVEVCQLWESYSKGLSERASE